MVDMVQEYVTWSGSSVEDKIKRWINRTREHIATKYDFEFLFKEVTQDTDSNNTYAWPTDMLDKIIIFLDDSDGNKIVIYEMPRNYWADRYKVPDASEPVDAPYHLIRKGNDFQIFPDPPSGRTLTLWCFAKPTELSDDDDEDLMSRLYGETIVWGACKRGAIYTENDSLKTEMDELYKLGINEMIGRESRKKIPKQVRFKTYKDFDVIPFRKKITMG